MTKKLMVLGLALALVIPTVSIAATFIKDDNVTIDQPLGDNTYAFGGMIRQTASVTGDLMAAGGDITLSASTSKDVLVAGGQLDISGAVGEDLRAAGGDIILNGLIGGDAVVAGGQVNILPGAVIAGGLSVAGGEVTINGRVDGDATIRAGEVNIGEKAAIGGKLIYYAQKEAVIPTTAKIGSVEYHKISPPVSAGAGATIFGAAMISWLIFKFLTLFITAWILIAILGAAAPRLISNTTTNFWRRLGWGFVTLIVAPILAVVLIITVIGIPFGIGIVALYIFLLSMAYIFAVVLAGSWLMKWLSKSPTYEATWKTAALGALAVSILGWIPLVGWLAYLLLFVASFGAISSFLLGWLRDNRN